MKAVKGAWMVTVSCWECGKPFEDWLVVRSFTDYLKRSEMVASLEKAGWKKCFESSGGVGASALRFVCPKCQVDKNWEPRVRALNTALMALGGHKVPLKQGRQDAVKTAKEAIEAVWGGGSGRSPRFLYEFDRYLAPMGIRKKRGPYKKRK